MSSPIIELESEEVFTGKEQKTIELPLICNQIMGEDE